MKIKDLYEFPVDSKIPVAGIVDDWESKEVIGKHGPVMRNKIRISDETGCIDAIHWGTPPVLRQGGAIKFMGTIQEAPMKEGYEKPYRSLKIDKSTLEIADAQPPQPVVEFDDENYLPTPRIGMLLVELHTLIGKYIKKMEEGK